MVLNDTLVTDLAKPFAKMVDKLGEFYSDPENKKKYQEWYLKKYGRMPDEVKV